MDPVISKEILSAVGLFKAPVLDFMKDMKDEFKHFLDDGLSVYLHNQREKYIKTNTFLYRTDKVDFLKVYYPITVSNGRQNIRIEGDLSHLLTNNFISIIGKAGSGKSMLMKYIFLNSLMTCVKIPIVLELRNLNDFEKGIKEYICNIIFDNKLSPNSKILERLLDKGSFIFLLDGYDEIFNKNRSRINHGLERFIDQYYGNSYIITSRPGVNIENFPRFINYYVNNLSKQDVENFITFQLSSIDPQLGHKIIEATRSPDNDNYMHYVSNPLLLSMFILTFNNYPSLPKNKSKFYWNVYDTLATKHDTITKKGAFQHERLTKLQNDEIENILKWFSYISLFEGNYSFDEQYLNEKLSIIKRKLNLDFDVNKLITDLTVSIAIIIIDGLEYKFPHKTLQEYFAAVLIKELSVENKSKIYEIKFEEQVYKSTDADTNFWDLCLELDKINFYKYFIIPNLKDMIKGVDKVTDNYQRILTFMENNGLKHEYQIVNDNFTNQRITINSLSHTLVLYLNISNSGTILNSPHKFSEKDGVYLRKAILNKEIRSSHIKGKMYSVIDYKIKITNNTKKVLDALKAINTINNVVEKIREKIVEFEEEIKNEEKSKIDLIELV